MNFTRPKHKTLLLIFGIGVSLLFAIVITNRRTPSTGSTIPAVTPSPSPLPPEPAIEPFTEELPTNYPYQFTEQLPYETESFIINYPEYDVYTVDIFSSDREGAKQEVSKWFRERGADSTKLKIRYITQTDEQILMEIRSLTPVETDLYRIDFYAKMDLFVITLKGSSPKASETEAYKWFYSYGIDDIAKINVRIEKML